MYSSACGGGYGRSPVSPDSGLRAGGRTLRAMDEQWWDGQRCPRCGLAFERYPAVSRVDNETYVCDPCGTLEALWDYQHQGNTPLPPLDQPVVLS